MELLELVVEFVVPVPSQPARLSPMSSTDARKDKNGRLARYIVLTFFPTKIGTKCITRWICWLSLRQNLPAQAYFRLPARGLAINEIDDRIQYASNNGQYQ